MINELLGDLRERMNRSLEALQEDLLSLRTGRASPALVEKLPVEYYGTMTALNQLAKRVTAVRGNMDGREPTRSLPWTAVAEAGGVSLYVLHDLGDLDLDPRAAGFAAVIHGHTHRAEIEWRDGVLILNPGSAGQPRSLRPATVARIVIEDGELTPEIVELR